MPDIRKLKNPPNSNLFFWEHGCDFCPDVWKAIEETRINLKVPPKYKLKPVEVRTIGAKSPEVRRFSEVIRGTPTIVLDDIIISGVSSTGWVKGFFEEWFREKKEPWF